MTHSEKTFEQDEARFVSSVMDVDTTNMTIPEHELHMKKMEVVNNYLAKRKKTLEEDQIKTRQHLKEGAPQLIASLIITIVLLYMCYSY